MINTPGLRTSLVGGIAVVVGLVALIFVPDTLPAILMMAGGLAVIGGFIWSLADFYLQPPAPPSDPSNESS